MLTRLAALALPCVLGAAAAAETIPMTRAIDQAIPLLVAEEARQTDCLARAIYWEARGQSVAGKLAVAHVVLNRARDPRWPQSLCGVIFQQWNGRCQFSWVCTLARNRRPPDGEAWMRSQHVAAMALAGAPDVTGGALYFHAVHVQPGWRYRQVARIDEHVFYAE